MDTLILVVVFSVVAGTLGYFTGKEEGRAEYHRGEAVCQKRLMGGLECVLKEHVRD